MYIFVVVLSSLCRGCFVYVHTNLHLYICLFEEHISSLVQGVYSLYKKKSSKILKCQNNNIVLFMAYIHYLLSPSWRYSVLEAFHFHYLGALCSWQQKVSMTAHGISQAQCKEYWLMMMYCERCQWNCPCTLVACDQLLAWINQSWLTESSICWLTRFCIMLLSIMACKFFYVLK